MTEVRDIRSTKYYTPNGRIYDSELIVLKRFFHFWDQVKAMCRILGDIVRNVCPIE
jgi:hypothetical protein